MSGIDHAVCAEDPLSLVAPLGEEADRPEPGKDSPPSWRRSFPGEARQLSEMRQWLRSFLPECPAKDDVVYVACELATNAVQHTRTGLGGKFGVEVIVHDDQAIRVAVADGGGPGAPQVVGEADRERGRGLRVVRALSTRDGYSGGEDGRQVWAEIPWHGIAEARVR